MARGLGVERAMIGREQILDERQLRRHALQLAPEAPAHAFAVLRQAVGRLKSHAVFGRHRKAPRVNASLRLNWGPRTPAASGPQATPNCLAIASIACASSMSRAVTPPASWVASTTSTVL